MSYAVFFITALIFSMVGLGGGSVYVPFLALFGYDIKNAAVPGGLFLVIITALASSINYVVHKQVNYRMALSLLGGSLVASVSGQLFLFRAASSFTLTLILCVAVLVTGLRFLVLPENFGQIKMKKLKHETIAGLLAGLAVGTVSVMAGIGGGFLIVPFMVHFSFDIKTAIGTSSFVIVFTGLSGFLMHLSSTFDRSKFPDMLLFGLAVFIGGLAGSKINAMKINREKVKIIIGFIQTALAVYLLIELFWLKKV